jgi:hypothetical protein
MPRQPDIDFATGVVEGVHSSTIVLPAANHCFPRMLNLTQERAGPVLMIQAKQNLVFSTLDDLLKRLRLLLARHSAA